MEDYINNKLIQIMQTGVDRNNRYEVMVKGVRLIEKIMTDKFKAKQMGITAKWKFLNESIQKGSLEGVDAVKHLELYDKLDTLIQLRNTMYHDEDQADILEKSELYSAEHLFQNIVEISNILMAVRGWVNILF